MPHRSRYLAEIIQSLKNLRKGLDEDHLYYAGVKRKALCVAGVGNLVSLGALAAVPLTGGVSYLVAAGVAAGVSTICNAPIFASTVAEQSAYSKYLKEAENALQDYGDYVKILSKSNGWVEGTDTALIATLASLISVGSFVLLTSCGALLTGTLAMQVLTGFVFYGAAPFIIVSLYFNIRHFTENGVTKEQETRTDMSRKLGKIIAELEVHYERTRGI